MMVFVVTEPEVPCRYTLVASEFVSTRSIYLKCSRPFLYDDRGDRARIGNLYLVISRLNRIGKTEMAHRKYSVRSAVPHRSMLSDRVLCNEQMLCYSRYPIR